ncbi:MAG: Flp pilus assembly complex ATPase component TadA [Pirellulaceae bacterium]|nr:Flp pilus assembly complex ATPase component TadA [Pirellulaceae bacterium]
MFGRKKKPASNEPTLLAGTDPKVALPPVEFKPDAPDKQQQQGVLISSRAMPHYPVAVMLVAHSLRNRADQILLDFTAQGASLRCRVDGVWEKLPPLDRENGDGMLAVLKTLCLLNPSDRRSQQKGKLPVKFQGIDWIFRFASQGVATGERALITIAPKKPVLNTLTDLGMRDGMQERFKQLINSSDALFLFSSPPGQGLPTTWRVGLEAADRFIRDFHAVFEVTSDEPEIINVTNHTFSSAAGETAQTVLKSLLLKQPDVLVMPDLGSAELAELICEEVKDEHRYAITRLVAGSAVEALLKLLANYRKSAKLMLEITCGVLNQRLVRRLCVDCRQPFQPSPALLQKLGLPPGRIQVLYQPCIPPPPEQRVDANGKPIEIQICSKCGGRGYFGRAAVFELLALNNEIRQAILKNPEPSHVLSVARRQGFLTIQEEGVLAVATGITSLPELQRVLTAKS